MSQNDLSIANQGFASFRSDLNSALQALGSTNSGTSAPSTTYANQLFYDTTNNILKIRNEDNDAFISLFTLDQTNDNIESLTINGAFACEGFTSNGIDDNADATAITIDSTERVGIGETSPQTKLHIKTADASATADSNSAVVIEGTDATRADLQFLGDASAFQVIYFGDNSDADIGRIAYDHTGNSMRFTVNASEAVRIASNQALAVGTTDVSSGAKFIVGSTDDDKRVFIQGSNQFRLGLKNGSNNHVWLGSGGADNFRVSNSSGSTLLELTSGGVLLTSGVGISNSSPSTALQVGDGTLDKRSTFNPSTAFAIGVKNGSNHGGFIGSGGADIMQFSNSGGGETMRIDSNGNLLVNTTSSTGFKMDLNANGGSALFTQSIGSGAIGVLTRPSANHNYNAMRFDNSSASIVGTISVGTGSTSFNTTSDYRLKENVTYDFDATTRLKQLKPCRFNFKIDTDNTVDGFLAHEVSSIVPEAITGKKDAVDADGNIEPQGIDQSKLVPLLVKTIQELEARITALEGA